MVAGHDHFNDYMGTYKDVQLIYGRKTGYAGNGPEPHFTKGARVFVLDLEDQTFSTYIREEDGRVLEQTDF